MAGSVDQPWNDVPLDSHTARSWSMRLCGELGHSHGDRKSRIIGQAKGSHAHKCGLSSPTRPTHLGA